MIGRRLGAYRDAVRAEFRAVLSEDHPPHLIAGSFAIGAFVTTLPTLGSGLLVLAAIGYRYAWANWLALFAAVAVLNPIAKTGVYAASFTIGTVLLGSDPGIVHPELSLTVGRAVLVRLLLGNVILAITFAGAGFLLTHYGVHAVRQYSNQG